MYTCINVDPIALSGHGEPLRVFYLAVALAPPIPWGQKAPTSYERVRAKTLNIARCSLSPLVDLLTYAYGFIVLPRGRANAGNL